MTTIYLNALFMGLLKGKPRFELDDFRCSTTSIDMTSLRVAGNHGGLPVTRHRAARDYDEVVDRRTTTLVDDFFHILEHIIQEFLFQFWAEIVCYSAFVREGEDRTPRAAAFV